MEEEILLGRINRAVEKGLGLSLTSDVRIYGKQAYLDELARVYPRSYLSVLDELKETILKKPDFVCYDETSDLFYFLEVYWKNGGLIGLEACIVHEGKAKRWFFRSLKKISSLWDRNYIRIRR